jgi:hypothetical protein
MLTGIALIGIGTEMAGGCSDASLTSCSIPGMLCDEQLCRWYSHHSPGACVMQCPCLMPILVHFHSTACHSSYPTWVYVLCSIWTSPPPLQAYPSQTAPTLAAEMPWVVMAAAAHSNIAAARSCLQNLTPLLRLVLEGMKGGLQCLAFPDKVYHTLRS